MTTETEDTDIGYEAVFGYRFNRYVAGELGLLQVGDLTNTIRGDYDAGTGAGIVPASVSFKYNFGGPIIAVVGILPLGDKFELYGRAGVLFASADRDATARIDGEGQQLGGIKGDSTEIVYGIGASYHINVMYSIRAEYMRFYARSATRAPRARKTSTTSASVSSSASSQNPTRPRDLLPLPHAPPLTRY